MPIVSVINCIVVKHAIDFDLLSLNFLFFIFFVINHSYQLPVIRLLSYIRWVTHKSLGGRKWLVGSGIYHGMISL